MNYEVLYNFILKVCKENFDGNFDKNTIINNNIELLSILWIKIEEDFEDIFIDDIKLFKDIKTIDDLIQMVLEND